MKLKAFYFFLVTVLVFLFPLGNNAQAENSWFFGLYGGRGTSSNIKEIFTLDAAVTDSYMATFFLGKELGSYRDLINAELEGQVVKHTGDQDHWEFNGVFTLRWLPFYWDHYIDTSLAVGGGVSYASEEPEIEIEKNDETNELLAYLLIELDFKIPRQNNWSIFGRLHHRSGAWGLFDDIYGGSNILCTGVKYTFN